MAIDIAMALELGQRDTNHLLIAAGFLPSSAELDFHAPELKWLRKTMTMSLKALDPYPAIVINESDDILMVNRGWVGLFNQTIDKTVLNNVTITSNSCSAVRVQETLLVDGKIRYR